jgi:hypothetical protein
MCLKKYEEIMSMRDMYQKLDVAEGKVFDENTFIRSIKDKHNVYHQN